MSEKTLVPPRPGLEPEPREELGDALSRRINADPEGVERGLAQLFWDLPRLLREAFLVHWYLTGAWFARASGHRRMEERIR